MRHNEPGTIEVTWRGGDQFDVSVRTHTLRTDQPLEDGGTDAGPSPVEMFVGSIAACVAHYARRYLRRHEIRGGLSVIARYQMAGRPARIGSIEFDVRAPGLPETLLASFSAVIEHCTVSNSLRLPPDLQFKTYVSG